MTVIQVYDEYCTKPTKVKPTKAPIRLTVTTPWRWFGRENPLDPKDQRELRFYVPKQSEYLTRKLIQQCELAKGLHGSHVDLTFEPMPGVALKGWTDVEKYGPFTIVKVRVINAHKYERRQIWLTYTRDPLAGEKGYES